MIYDTFIYILYIAIQFEACINTDTYMEIMFAFPYDAPFPSVCRTLKAAPRRRIFAAG